MNKTIAFEEFWKAYPLKKAKIPAEKAWNRLSVSDKRAAYKGVQTYHEDCTKTGVSIAYPATYLNQRRWTDELEQSIEKSEESKPTEMLLW